MDLSNTHGDTKYKGKNKTASKKNTRAKVIRNPDSIYGKPIAKPTNWISLVVNTIVRASIVGIGIGTLFGTFLANRDLTKPLFPEVNLSFLASVFPGETESNNNSESVAEIVESTVIEEEKTEDSNSIIKDFSFTREDNALKNKLIELKAKYPNLEPAAYFIDLDNGVFVNMNGIKALPRRQYHQNSCSSCLFAGC